MNRDQIKGQKMTDKVQREIGLLRLCNAPGHPAVMRLIQVINTPTDLFLVTEFAPGGDLYDYILQRRRLEPRDAQRIFRQLMDGVFYLHSLRICHRDLKPENILLDQGNNVKIADFGLSNIMRDGEFLRTSCGSVNYAAPEIINGERYAGPGVDVWSCGVILYALLCGSLPFDDDHMPRLLRLIRNGRPSIPSYVDRDARALISAMLTANPLERIDVATILSFPWVASPLPPKDAGFLQAGFLSLYARKKASDGTGGSSTRSTSSTESASSSSSASSASISGGNGSGAGAAADGDKKAQNEGKSPERAAPIKPKAQTVPGAVAKSPSWTRPSPAPLLPLRGTQRPKKKSPDQVGSSSMPQQKDQGPPEMEKVDSRTVAALGVAPATSSSGSQFQAALRAVDEVARCITKHSNMNLAAGRDRVLEALTSCRPGCRRKDNDLKVMFDIIRWAQLPG